MQVTVEEGSGLERRMRVEIPEDRVEGAVNERLQSMTRTARVPGFRPGKVPLKVVAQRYGRQVRDEVIGEIVRTSFYDALVQQNLRPAGSPTIDPVDSRPGEGVEYTAVFEVYPELSEPEVEGLEIARPVAEVGGADVERTIESLRRQRRRFEPVERPAREGDRVTIDFEGTIDGEPFENGSGSEVRLELGSGQPLEAIEDALAGASAGEQRSIEVDLPASYRPESLAGRRAVFEVRVSEVSEPVLPEVDDEFARTFGVGEGGAEALRAEVRRNLERELEDAIRARTKERVMDALLAANPVSPPAALVEEEMERMFRLRGGELAQQGIDPERLGLAPEMFREQAARRIALGLLLAEIVKRNGLTADEERVRERIESIASTYEEPSRVVSWYYADKARLADIESTVLEDQVVAWMLQRATVRDEQTSFDELLNPGQTSDAGASPAGEGGAP